MKSIIFFACLSLCFFACTSDDSQDKFDKDAPFMGMKGDVESIEDYLFNAQEKKGNIQKSKTPVFINTIKFNDAGQIIYTLNIDSDTIKGKNTSSLVEIVGNKKVKEIQKVNNQIDKIMEPIPSTDDMQIIKRYDPSMPDLIDTLFIFLDKEDENTKHIVQKGSNGHKKESIRTYLNGHIIKQIELEDDIETTSYMNRIENGNVVETACLEKRRIQPDTSKYVYTKFDEMGNWTECLSYFNNKLLLLSERKIKYREKKE